MPMSLTDRPILDICDLKVKARTILGTAELLDIDRLTLGEGEILGIVGESGSGKSILALTIMGLLPTNVYVERGSITYKGEDLLKKSPREMSTRIRGKLITMIFQDPMASLNPVFTVKQLLAGVIREHHPDYDQARVHAKAMEMLRLVKLSDPEVTMEKYPHELSGGMRQRVLIAMALSSGARLLISDEATRALDVTIQAGILKLITDLREQLHLSTIFISSNIALATSVCQRVGILYAGQLLEVGPVREVAADPRHPYTRSFLASLPVPEKKGQPLPIIGGRSPDPLHRPQGCPFGDRCPLARDECRASRPPAVEVAPGHLVACYRWEEHLPARYSAGEALAPLASCPEVEERP